jgi:hypothetical protein
MAEKARERSRSTRGKKREDEPQGDGNNGHEADVARDEGELASYLAERIKPGLNRGAIPLLARSIAREIARDEYHSDDAEADDESGEKTDEASADGRGGGSDLESDLHKLQTQLGKDWILSLSVQGGDSWLVAEKEDVTQRVEAPDASVLSQAVKLLNESGGRSNSARRPSGETKSD